MELSLLFIEHVITRLKQEVSVTMEEKRQLEASNKALESARKSVGQKYEEEKASREILSQRLDVAINGIHSFVNIRA